MVDVSLSKVPHSYFVFGGLKLELVAAAIECACGYVKSVLPTAKKLLTHVSWND